MDVPTRTHPTFQGHVQFFLLGDLVAVERSCVPTPPFILYYNKISGQKCPSASKRATVAF